MIRNTAPRSSGGRRTLVVAIVTGLCLLGVALPATPASADASASAKIMELCAHGQSLAGFTVKQYRATLENLTTEEIEYHSECVEAIQQAELAAASRKGPTGSGGTSGGREPGGDSPNAVWPVEPSPTQERVLEATREHGAPAVRFGRGEGSLSPGVVHPNLASAASDLPAAVLAVIVAVIGGILLLVGHEIRKRTQRSARS